MRKSEGVWRIDAKELTIKGQLGQVRIIYFPFKNILNNDFFLKKLGSFWNCFKSTLEWNFSCSQTS